MPEKVFRNYDLELRRASTTGRVIEGLAVPYGTPTVIYDQGGPYTEVIAPGAFAKSIAERGERVRILANHDGRKFPIGRPTRLYEKPDGLYLEALVADTAQGRDALALIHDDIAAGLSVGFRPIEDRWDGNTRVILEASLIEVSLVGQPAYPDAKVLAVRSSGRRLSLADARASLPPTLTVADALQRIIKE